MADTRDRIASSWVSILLSISASLCDGGDVVENFHLIALSYQARPFKNSIRETTGFGPHNKKAHPSFWNRLLKDFSFLRPPPFCKVDII
jgi:hypothetical protein